MHVLLDGARGYGPRAGEDVVGVVADGRADLSELGGLPAGEGAEQTEQVRAREVGRFLDQFVEDRARLRVLVALDKPFRLRERLVLFFETGVRAGDPRRLRLAFGFLREGIASCGTAFFDLFLIPAGGLFGRLGRRDAQPFVDLLRRFGQADAFVGRRETHRHKEVLVAREGAAALLQILDFLDLEVAEQPSDVGVAVGRIERQDLGVDLVGALELAALMQLSRALEERFELRFGIAELRRVVVAVDHRGFGVPHRGAEADDLLLFRVEPRQQFGALLGRGERVLLRQFRRGDPGQVDLAFRRVEPCGDLLRGEPRNVVDPVSDHLLDPVEAMVHFGAQFFQSRAGRRRNGGRDRRSFAD